MEKTFTFRFYDVTKGSLGVPSMADMLQLIADIPLKVNRERQLGQDYVVRLENYEPDGPGAFLGELIRCQATNFPSELDGDKRIPLTADRLGHSVVFRYSEALGILGIQYDNRVISPGRILDYLAAFNASAIYSMRPKINDGAWKKFNSNGTKKLTIRIADPKDMADLSGDGRAASDGFRAMGAAYGAPSILVEISMGHRKGFLKSAVHDLATQIYEMAGGRLDKLSAVVSVDDISEPIDLIEDRVVIKDQIGITDRDPEANWKIKKGYLSHEMKQLYG